MKTIILCLSLLALGINAQAQAPLDFWSNPTQTAVVPDGRVLNSTGSSTATVTLGPVTTSRRITQQVTDANTSSFGFGADVGNGQLSISNPFSGASIVTLVWGESGDMNLDLTTFGNAFQFSMLWNDSGSSLSMSVWNGTTEYSTGFISLSPSYDMDSPIDFPVTFDSFGGADFTNIDRISFTVNTTVAADVVFSDMQVVPVPEPSSAMLVGLVGLLSLTRRRRFLNAC